MTDCFLLTLISMTINHKYTCSFLSIYMNFLPLSKLNSQFHCIIGSFLQNGVHIQEAFESYLRITL